MDALSEPFRRRIHFNEQAWTYPDVISIVITVASVWKHPKSQYWTACCRDQNGWQRRISTKETNNKKALKIVRFGLAGASDEARRGFLTIGHANPLL